MISKNDIIENYSLDTAARIVDLFYGDLVSNHDQKLLDLAFAKNVDQEKLDLFLREWDIEKFGEGKSMILSYLMKSNLDLNFSDYEKPRLEGLLKYHRFHNLKLIAHFNKIVRALNDEGIFPLIFKGGAMRHIRSNLPRPMGDIDILIATESEFLKTRQICQKLGYDEEVTGNHSVDLHLPGSKEGTLDIHRYIDLEVNYDKSLTDDLFARAKLEKTFAAKSFVPCHEDLLFLAMINLARNLNNKTSINGILYALFDFKYLSESSPDFNWDLVLKNIVQTKTYSQALMAMKFINKIIPDLLPESLLNNEVINRKFNRYCQRIIFNHFYFNDFRQRYKKLNIKDAVKSLSNLKYYLAKKPQYFVVKRIVRKSHFLIKIFLRLNSKKLKNI